MFFVKVRALASLTYEKLKAYCKQKKQSMNNVIRKFISSLKVPPNRLTLAEKFTAYLNSLFSHNY